MLGTHRLKGRRGLPRPDRLRAGQRRSESLRLGAVALLTERLQIRVLERGPSAGDLDDVIDLQLLRSEPPVAAGASVAIPALHVNPRRVPEVVPVKLPSAVPRAVRRAGAGQGTGTFHAPPRPSRFGAAASPVVEPCGREAEETASRADRHARSRSARLDGHRATGVSHPQERSVGIEPPFPFGWR